MVIIDRNVSGLDSENCNLQTALAFAKKNALIYARSRRKRLETISVSRLRERSTNDSRMHYSGNGERMHYTRRLYTARCIMQFNVLWFRIQAIPLFRFD